MAEHKVSLKNEEEFGRLVSAKTESWKRLQKFRENRMNALRQFVGSHYGPADFGTASRVPVNFLELAVNIYLRQLAASAPTILWTTERPTLRPQAAAAELMHNHVIKEIHFKQTLKVWVLESLFGHGVLKVGLTQAALHEAFGPHHDAGQPFADIVFGDDWVHDITAKSYEQVNFAGNRYWLTVDETDRAFGLSNDQIIKLSAMGRGSFSSSDLDPSDRSESLSGGADVVSLDPFMERIELWDLWLPHTNEIVTMSDAIPDEPLHVVNWEGPEIGPYHRIVLEDVPGNVMPLPPVSVMMDLHELANILWNKMGNQSQRQKHNFAYSGAAASDADRYKRAMDGEFIKMDNPELIKELATPGPDPRLLAFFLQSKDMFAWLLGNLDTLGGLSPQAETLGQERLLSAGASRRLDDMRDRITDTVQTVQESIGDYIWNDPDLDKFFTKRIGGPGLSGVDATIRFNSEMKEGDLIDFNIGILLNSMQELTPSERLQTVQNFVERFYIPLASLFEQQGITLDLKELSHLVARYTGVCELPSIIKTGQPPPPLIGGRGDRGRQSPVTTRNVVRKSIPGASRSGKDDVLTRILMGAGVQGSEGATLGRPTG